MINVNDFKIGLIYKYTSPNGKVYIGKTINETKRRYKHKIDSIKNNTHFGNAIKKYGIENLEYEILIKFKPTYNIKKLTRVLNKLEERYIKLYNSYDRNYGYNLTEGGDGTCGYKWTEGQKLTKSESMKALCKETIPEYLKKGLEKG